KSARSGSNIVSRQPSGSAAVLGWLYGEGRAATTLFRSARCSCRYRKRSVFFSLSQPAEVSVLGGSSCWVPVEQAEHRKGSRGVSRDGVRARARAVVFMRAGEFGSRGASLRSGGDRLRRFSSSGAATGVSFSLPTFSWTSK